MKKRIAWIVAFMVTACCFGCSSNNASESSSEKSEGSSEIATEDITEEPTEKATEKPTEKPTKSSDDLKLEKEYEFHSLSLLLPESTLELPSSDEGAGQINTIAFKDASMLRLAYYPNSTNTPFSSVSKEDLYAVVETYAEAFSSSSSWTGKEKLEKTEISDTPAYTQIIFSGDTKSVVYHLAFDEALYSICFTAASSSGDDSLALLLADEIVKSIDLKASENSAPPEVSDDNSPNVSLGQENALKKAQSYVSHSAFSYSGLIGQLEYSGYSHDEAVYGADNCGADWNAEALEKAKSYISHSAFSYSGLYDQLLYEEYSDEQARYGADNCGADWNEEAAEKAESYMSHSSFSREELYDQLLYEGFTEDQAEHGVASVGY